ncbi:MAG: HEAT repeat domain-containing protein, partial [Actinomycetota bacterium]
MRRLLALLKVRPGEGPLVGRLLALMVVLWSAFAVGGNGVESLLLARVGARTLPTMYIALGVVTFAFLAGAGRIARADPRRAVPAAYLGMAVAIAASRPLLSWDPWGYRISWLAMMILWTLAGQLSWSLAAALHDTRQAKRLFPLYGAGLVVGLVVGGFLTGPLAGLLGAEQLVFVWAAGTAVAAFTARWASAAGRPMAAAGPREASPGFTQGAASVVRSPLLGWMAVSLALFALLLFMSTFLFARAAAARYPDPEGLAGFLGVFSGAATGTALVVSLAVANRLYARIGTVNAVLALAALCLIGFGALVVASAFAVVAVFRFSQIVWVNGVWAPGWQSLFNVVPPGRRPAGRAFMDAVPLQVGTAAAGGLLIVAERALSAQAMAGLGAGAAAVAVVAMARARVAYVRALAEALREGNPEVFADGGGRASDRQALAAVVAGIEDDDASVRRLSVDLLAGHAGDPASVRLLEERLGDDDPGVRLSAVRGIGRSAAPDLGRLSALCDDPDPAVRAAASRIMAEAGWDADVAAGALSDPDPSVRATGAAALARAPAALAVGPLAEALEDPDPGVRRAAAGALGAFGPAAVPALFECLDDPAREEWALEALRSLPWADPDPLLPYAPERARGAARFAALARAVGGGGDDERTRLLVAALQERSSRRLRLALRAMGRRRPDAVRPALDNLWSPDPDQRANAIEIVDAAGHPEVARLLMGIWESADAPGDAPAAFAELLADADPWLRACAVVAIGADEHADRLAAAVRRVAVSDPEVFVREAAARALEGPHMMETLATLSLMDRALCLRRVPMFAELEGSDLQQVAEAASEHAFDNGEVLADEGEPGDGMHVVVSGEVSVVVDRAAGGGREVAVRRAGEHVGEMSLLGEEPRMASLVARGPVRTLGLDRRRFERLVRERPDVAHAV